MLQNAGGLYVATYKCAWRHSGVPFFDIWPSKSGPDPSVFYDFDLKMCFSPQRRAIFADRDLQNGSGAEGFCTFWRTNVLRATAACNFWTSQLPKWLRECGVLHILTFKCAFRHSRVPFFTCPPNSYLRTRRFSEPTFRTSGTTIHWENTAIRDFTNFFRACWTACEWLYTHVDLLCVRVFLCMCAFANAGTLHNTTTKLLRQNQKHLHITVMHRPCTPLSTCMTATPGASSGASGWNQSACISIASAGWANERLRISQNHEPRSSEYTLHNKHHWTVCIYRYKIYIYIYIYTQ